jgi:hypothetical protein
LLYAKIGGLTLERDFFAKSLAARLSDPDLAIAALCRLLKVARSTLY